MKTTYKDTLLNYRDLAADIKWFCAQTAWRLHSRSLQTPNVNSNVNQWMKLFPISDNVSYKVVIQGVLVQHFRFL